MILAVTGQSSLADGYYESTASFYNAVGPNATANFPLSGSYASGSAILVGSGGYFWSATSRSDTYTYFLYLGSSDVYLAGDNKRFYGSSVRCVFGS